ncbi:PQQ-dependent sugar dehydrogenase [Massilia sp. LXY-6]|uniref:PQQ-dependent sugar dehydrogenase n=1 Tax=Massilia sp. LXY-6 TaxID=3379823 RepID=UPI003EDFDC05
MLSRTIGLPLPLLSLFLLAACGGGGGGGGATPDAGTPVVQPPAPPPGSLTLALAPFASGLSSPTFLTAPPGDARQFIVERAGRILVMQGGTLLPQAFLDLRAVTDVTGEGGLLSMAFDPGYAGNGRFYVYRTNANHDIVVERYTVSSDPDRADPASKLTVLQIAHPVFTNHFGGLLAFGPDGYLYLGTGDGGSAGDPNGNAQNPASLLGKLLRLDVRSASAAVPYLIPETNPYRNQSGSRPEIWALGLRNPWRFAFDAGQLYIADVGQDQREEIDLESASQGGLNYGWNRMEGSACYQAQTCDRTGLALPVLDYGHDGGACSITGGYVYRGSAIPELAGHYFYSDYCAGFLRSFLAVDRAVTAPREWSVSKPGQVLSFGQDGQGELYVLTLNGIWKIVRGS